MQERAMRANECVACKHASTDVSRIPQIIQLLLYCYFTNALIFYVIIRSNKKKGISQEIFSQQFALLTLLYLEYTVAPHYMYSDRLGTTEAAFLYDHRLKG